MTKKSLAATLALALCAALFGCAPPPEKAERVGFALDTAVSITIYGQSGAQAQSALDACFAMINSLESMWSRTRPDSEIYRLNETGSALILRLGTPVSQKAGRDFALSGEDYAPMQIVTAELIREALRISEASGGAFDITVGGVSSLWDFKEKRIPDGKEIVKALATVGCRNIMDGGGYVALLNGAQLDLGAIAKGAIADVLVGILARYGINSAVINLGGNVYAHGKRPDGKPFTIGIRSPWDENALLGTIELSDLSIVTSGASERGFEENGRYYHHLLDPKTGWPAETGLASVSVVSESSAKADALSTALFVLGPEKGMELAEKEGAEAIFALENGEILQTPGIEKLNFIPKG